MADATRKKEENGSRPPARFLRPGYITTAGSDEIRDRAERILREHEEEGTEAEDRER